jgi:heterotetrameric sarcosine oxidase delta subunit
MTGSGGEAKIWSHAPALLDSIGPKSPDGAGSADHLQPYPDPGSSVAMLKISCPCCGPRDETEFTYGGQSHIARPSIDVDDETWARYLFVRDNPKGLHFERWCHTYGCTQWFNVARDTVSHDIHAIYRMGDPKPDLVGRPA